MQWVSSRIWTSVAVFVSYDDNNYTTGTSLKKTFNDQHDTRPGQFMEEELDDAE